MRIQSNLRAANEELRKGSHDLRQELDSVKKNLKKVENVKVDKINILS